MYVFKDHCWFLEHRNSQKSVWNIQQHFSCLLDEWIEKICKKKISRHCCMKCPQILREKTLSQKFAVIALRIQWKLFTEGNAFKKCQQIILPFTIYFLQVITSNLKD